MPSLDSLYMCSIIMYSSKKIREGKKKWDVVQIFKNKNTIDKYVLRHSTEITFDSDIQTTIIIDQIEARMKLHNIIFVPKLQRLHHLLRV